MIIFKESLKNVMSEAETRQKSAKYRRLQIINEDIEPIFNAVSTSLIVLQRFHKYLRYLLILVGLERQLMAWMGYINIVYFQPSSQLLRFFSCCQSIGCARLEMTASIKQ